MSRMYCSIAVGGAVRLLVLQRDQVRLVLAPREVDADRAARDEHAADQRDDQQRVLREQAPAPRHSTTRSTRVRPLVPAVAACMNPILTAFERRSQRRRRRLSGEAAPPLFCRSWLERVESSLALEHIDRLHHRRPRALPCPRDDPIDRLGRPHHRGLDRSVAAVAHPAANAQSPRLLDHRPAVADRPGRRRESRAADEFIHGTCAVPRPSRVAPQSARSPRAMSTIISLARGSSRRRSSSDDSVFGTSRCAANLKVLGAVGVVPTISVWMCSMLTPASARMRVRLLTMPTRSSPTSSSSTPRSPAGACAESLLRDDELQARRLEPAQRRRRAHRRSRAAPRSAPCRRTRRPAATCGSPPSSRRSAGPGRTAG